MKSLLLIVVTMFGCNSAGSDQSTVDSTGQSLNDSAIINKQVPEKDTTSLAGTWYLLPVLPSDTVTGRLAQLNFMIPGNRFTGNTGCNSMSGSFQFTDTSLVFDKRIMTTKMTCPGYNEQSFLESLLNTNRFRFENGVLILLFDETELSKWSRTRADKPAAVNKV